MKEETKTQLRTQSLCSWRQQGNIELIPPMSEEFCIEEARRWALNRRYMLVQGVVLCAHGLLGLRWCPANCSRIGDFDHANVWAHVDARGHSNAFILSAPYLKEPSSELRTYAEHHGLRIDQWADDAWYGYGTIPIRLTLKEQNYLGPLEEMLVVLNYVAPTAWPDESDEEALDFDEVSS
jgi:hypothetical protein